MPKRESWKTLSPKREAEIDREAKTIAKRVMTKLSQDGTINRNRPGGTGGSSVPRTIKTRTEKIRKAAEGTATREYRNGHIKGEISIDAKGHHVASVTAGKTTTTTRHRTRQEASDWMDNWVEKHYPGPGKKIGTPITKEELLKPRYNYADNE